MPARSTLNILVVDDDPGAAKGLARLLRACGHAVHIAYGTAEGLELAARVRPDLILHDIAMPVMDGYEAARRLRGMAALSHTALIACSASVNEQRARAAGFDGWLVKPIGDGELEAVLAMVLQRIAHAPLAERDSVRGAGD